MNNDNRKIVGYNTQTGEPIYASENNEIMNNQNENNRWMPKNNMSINQYSMNDNNVLQQNDNGNNSILNQENNNQTTYNNFTNGFNQANNQNSSYITNSINNNQSAMNSNQQFNYNNKKNNTFAIIFSIIICLVIATVVTIVVLFIYNKKDKNSSNGTINDYDNKTPVVDKKKEDTDTKIIEEKQEDPKEQKQDESQDDNSNEDIDSNFISFQGFKFEKVSGYEYTIEDDSLNIEKANEYINVLNILELSYQTAEDNYEEIAMEFENLDFTLYNYGKKNVLGMNILYYEIEQDDLKGYIYITSSPNDNYVYEGAIIGYYLNTFDEKMLDDAVQVVSKSQYVGNYSNYATSFNYNLDLEK